MPVSTPNDTCQLSDDIIGSIFDWIIPNPNIRKDEGTQTLKTACLVSHQFAYYGRRGLYSKVHVETTGDSRHYLRLCRRHRDMAKHIKTFSIAGNQDCGEDAKARIFADLCNILTTSGAVKNFRIVFVFPWDKWTVGLQVSVIKLTLAYPLDVLELGNVCECFPFHLIPIPWISRRFSINGFASKTDVSDTLGFMCSSRGVTAQVVDACRTEGTPLSDSRRAVLMSVWVEAIALPTLAGYFRYPEFRGLREVYFMFLTDDTLPTVIEFLDASQDTLESLIINCISISTSNSPYLSHLTNKEFPQLHTLTIISVVLSGTGGHFIKSLAWFLLHIRRSGKWRLRQLNLVFMDCDGKPGLDLNPISVLMASVIHPTLIKGVFDILDFFKLEQVIQSILLPRGSVSLWFMFGQVPILVEELRVKRFIEKRLTHLHREGRIEGHVAQADESLLLADGLSLAPKEVFVSNYEVLCRLHGPSEEEIYQKMPELRP